MPGRLSLSLRAYASFIKFFMTLKCERSCVCVEKGGGGGGRGGGGGGVSMKFKEGTGAVKILLTRCL